MSGVIQTVRIEILSGLPRTICAAIRAGQIEAGKVCTTCRDALKGHRKNVSPIAPVSLHGSQDSTSDIVRVPQGTGHILASPSEALSL